MPFKNEYLTEEEKQMIAEAKIHDPRYSIAVKEYLNPRSWTIDRERNIVLKYCGEMDRFERCNQEVFVLFNKVFNNEHVMSFVLENDYFSKEMEIELKEKYRVDGIKKWKLLDKKIPNDSEISDLEILKIFVEALSTYGINGRVDQDYSIKAFLEVGGEIIS